MLIVFLRYIFVVTGFVLLGLLPFNAFDYHKDIGLSELLEYLVPALISFGLAYKSYPRTPQRN